MRHRCSGFTMIEMVFVLLIGAILTSIALGSFQNVQSRFAARSAKQMYATLHQRARAIAIEKGEIIVIAVDLAGDSAWIRRGPVRSDVTHFRSELNVDLRGTTSYIMCMTPRGYADLKCGGLGSATSTSPIRLEFWRNQDSTSVWVLPLGQLVGL